MANVIGNGPKILFWDIECTPKLKWIWRTGKQYIDANYIVMDSFIISAAWSWHGEKKIHAISVLDNKIPDIKDRVCIDGKNIIIKPLCDRHIVEKMYEIIQKADCLVHHNGDKYDLKKLKTRGFLHKLGPLAKIKTIDTLKQARKHFDFTSNKLGKIAEYIEVTQKGNQDMLDFIGCAAGHKRSLAQAVSYNKRDIIVQKEISYELWPYIDTINVQDYQKGIKHKTCISCGSQNLIKKGFLYTAHGKKQMHKCKDCGKKMMDRTIKKDDYRLKNL